MIVILFLPLAIILAISACVRLWMTGWQSGSATFYGVRVDPEFERRYEAVDIDRTYTLQVIWLTVVLIVVMAGVAPFISLTRAPRLLLPTIFGLALAQRLGMQVIYWRARQKVLPFAASLETVRTVDLASFADLSLEWKLFYWTAVVLPIGLLAATALYVRMHFGLIPLPQASRSPFNPLGRVVLGGVPWTKRTIYGVYKPLVESAMTNLVLIVVAYAFNYRSRICEWGDEVESRWTYRKLLMSRLAVLQWLTTVQLVLRALLPLAGTDALPIARSKFLMVMSIWTLVWSVLSLVLLCKLYLNRPSGAADTGPDQSWKFGQYYFNRQDPAMIVPTRFGVGHTLNWGQPLAWAVTTGALLIFVFVWVGPNYIPQLPRSPSMPMGSIADPAGRAALFEAAARLNGGDASAGQTIKQLAQARMGEAQFLNNAAYDLALAGKELPDARMYAKRAVGLIEERLGNLNAGYVIPGTVNQERVLATYWDTLGWVCYRQGELDCAHRYLLGAWSLNRRVLFASHLGQIEEAQGRRNDAAMHYKEALGEVGQEEDRQEVLLRLNALAGTNERAAQSSREIPLAYIQRRSGVSYVDVLFANANKGTQRSLPVVVSESETTEPPFSAREKTTIATLLPKFPFPDAGPEELMARVRVTCLRGSSAACSMLPYTPDETRNELYQPMLPLSR